MRTMRRRGVLLLLVVLPDGSRSLIPRAGATASGRHDPFESGAAHREPCLASLAICSAHGPSWTLSSPLSDSTGSASGRRGELPCN